MNVIVIIIVPWNLISTLFNNIFVDVPLRLVLTKVDRLHLGEPNQAHGIFKNRVLYDKVRKVKEIFGLQDCHILPIANYVNSDKQNLNQDVLALLALDNILQETVAAFR